jgi:hypothetical protein
MSELRRRTTMAAYDAGCLALAGMAQTLTPAHFARSTNGAPWTLYELIVHIVNSVRIRRPAEPAARLNVPPGTAADYHAGRTGE